MAFTMTKSKAAFVSILSNTVIVVFKIVVGVAMGSVSIISEAIHSGIDLVASLIAFISIRKSLVPADEQHAYGHGKFENISGFFEAILIFVAAGLIIYEAVKKLYHPGPIENLDWGIAVMLLSAGLNTIVSITLFRVAKRENSIALEADAMHLSVDVFTSLGVMVGLAIIWLTGWNVVDPIIALLVAVAIMKASWELTARSIDDLADRALPDVEIEALRAIITKHSEVLDYHRLRTRKSGNRREVDVHLKLDTTTQVGIAHTLCDTIEHEIKDTFPGINVVIHVEPFHENNKPAALL